MEARVAAGISLLVALALGAVLFATMRAVTNRSLSRASEDLATARSTFASLLDSRAESAAALTRLVTELPVFRAYMTDSRLVADASSVSEMADRYRRQLKAQFCIVTDAHGAWMGTPGWPAGTAAPAAVRAMIDAAVAGQSRRDIVAVDDRLFLFVAEPARFAEEVLGTLSVGYALDDAVAEQLARDDALRSESRRWARTSARAAFARATGKHCSAGSRDDRSGDRPVCRVTGRLAHRR